MDVKPKKYLGQHFLIDEEIRKIKDGILGDIAPSILDIMNIKKPEEMTCKSLIVH